MSAGPIIEVTELRKEFRTRRGPVTAVAGVNFQVAAGAFVGYAGPNGAGKSTTIKMMSGLLVPTSGRVLVDGLVPSRERRRLARRIGVVFGQRTQLWWDLPLEQSFQLVRHLYRIGAADYRRRLDHLIQVLQLGPLLHSPVRSLSLGQRMRSELAAAVLPRPRVLFLDEPTIGLDVEAKAAVRGFLRELNRGDGTTVILTTHDLDDIAELCERLLIIDHGKVIYDGTVEELRHRYGTTRVLVIDLRDDVELVVEGAKLVRADGHRRWLEFARDEVSAAVLIARVMAAHEVVDLTLKEPDIEDIVRRIYRGEAGLQISPQRCRGRPLHYGGMRQRSVAWDKDDGAGAEFAEVALDAEILSARGVSIGGEPVAYRLDYVLETGPGFVTTRLEVTARGEGWRRTLDLRRAGSGDWTASVTTEDEAPDSLDAPGEDPDGAAGGPGGQPEEPGGLRRLGRVAGALDCDLGLSPLTNSMPVLRHRLLAEEGSVDFLMAWVSVPDLGVHPSRQRYTALGDLPGGSRRIRFESLDSEFTADLSFDRDGLVVDYPGIGRRLG